jgi:hypothetical protein
LIRWRVRSESASRACLDAGSGSRPCAPSRILPAGLFTGLPSGLVTRLLVHSSAVSGVMTDSIRRLASRVRCSSRNWATLRAVNRSPIFRPGWTVNTEIIAWPPNSDW